MPLSPQEQKVLNLIAQSKNDDIALFLMDLLGVVKLIYWCGPGDCHHSYM